MRTKALVACFLLFAFSSAIFCQSPVNDRGWTLVDLPPWSSLAGDGEGGFCGIDMGNPADPAVSRWSAGQAEILVKQSQLGDVKMFSSFGAIKGNPSFSDNFKIICSKEPIFNAYSAYISGMGELRGIFSGTKQIISPNGALKLSIPGQSGQIDKLFFDAISIERNQNRDILYTHVFDGPLTSVIYATLEMKQSSLVVLSDPKFKRENKAVYHGCPGLDGFWEISADWPVNTGKSYITYLDKNGNPKIAKSEAVTFKDGAMDCNKNGEVIYYLKNGVVNISRFSETNPDVEIPLLSGNVFSGFKFYGIVSLKVMDDDTVFFIAQTDKGNTLFRLAPKSASPELIKASNEEPSGSPEWMTKSGNVIALKAQNGSSKVNWLLAREPVITNFKAVPSVAEPGQPVKLAWDISGQFRSLALVPGIIANFGPGHYEVTVYPPVTMPYTLKVGWIGGEISRSVTVTVTPSRPEFRAEGVVNSASGTELSPGAMATVYGKGLSSQAITASVPLPLKLGGTQVQIDGIACPMLFTSGGQVNFVIPSEIQPGDRKMVVIRDYIFSNEVVIKIVPVAPALFLVSKDQGMFFDSSYRLAGTKENPLRGGETYFAYANGLSSSCNLKAGEPAPLDRLCAALGQISVWIGGKPAEVLFAGLAPGLLAYQINFRVLELPGGEKSIVFISVDGKESVPSPAFLEVR